MTPCLFSVSYAGYWGQHSLRLPEFVRKAAALGYPTVEIAAKRPHLSVLDYESPDSLHQLREEADKAGVKIATIAGYTDFTSGRASAEVPFIEMQVHYVAKLAAMARILGAKIVRVFSGYLTQPEFLQDDWTRCVRALRECAELAASQDVVIGLQNHHDVGISVSAYEELLGDVGHPNLKGMFDPWSVALVGDDMYSSAKRLAPLMVQTTLADYVRLGQFKYVPSRINYQPAEPPLLRAVPLGDGFLDLEAFFAGLKEGGFNGYVAYEMCSPLRGGGSEENLDDTARKSLAVLRRLIGPA